MSQKNKLKIFKGAYIIASKRIEELRKEIENLKKQNNLMYECFDHDGTYVNDQKLFCTEREDCVKCKVNEIYLSELKDSVK